ncbi:MAG: hypothetical protein AAB654_02545, partial [Acidobacteriota bacterium]
RPSCARTRAAAECASPTRTWTPSLRSTPRLRPRWSSTGTSACAWAANKRTARIPYREILAAAVLRDLESRPGHWLHDAAGRMTEAIAADWNQWREG